MTPTFGCTANSCRRKGVSVMISDFLTFLRETASHWSGLVTGSVVTLILYFAQTRLKIEIKWKDEVRTFHSLFDKRITRVTQHIKDSGLIAPEVRIDCRLTTINGPVAILGCLSSLGSFLTQVAAAARPPE
jgi:hypothetical protein